MIPAMLRGFAARIFGRKATRPSQTELPSYNQHPNDIGSEVTSTENDVEPQGADKRGRTGFWANLKTRLCPSSYKPTPRMISDFTLGISDGMTVPFALTAGLSFVGSTKIVVLGGVAELVAGALSMAVGGWLGARGEHKAYKTRVTSTQRLIAEDRAFPIVHEILNRYPGISATTAADIHHGLEHSPDGLLNFIMRNHHQLAEPEASRPFVCGLTIGAGYVIGGLLPLIPYFCVQQHQVRLAFYVSVGIMILAFLTFGYTKTGIEEGWKSKKSVKSAIGEAFTMLAVGASAVGVAVLVIMAINHTL